MKALSTLYFLTIETIIPKNSKISIERVDQQNNAHVCIGAIVGVTIEYNYKD